MKMRIFVLSLSLVGLLSANETFLTKCSTCHGMYGEKEVQGKVGKTRALATINQSELKELLIGYKHGTIHEGEGQHGLGKIMRGQLRPLSDGEIGNLATYISGLSPKVAKK